MNDYWKKRELEHIRKSVKSDKQLAKEIAKRHRIAMDEIQDEINRFYAEYATTEGITMAEAQKRVAKIDIQRYRNKAKKYVKGAHSDNEALRYLAFTDKANQEMRLYNVTMKINRLQMLKMNIDIELIAMGNDVEAFLYRSFNRHVYAEYERLSAILGMTVNPKSPKAVEKIVNASFKTATWSERLWTNQNALRKELDTLIHRSILQGRNPKEMARELRKSFDVSVSDSERLLITEIARIQADVSEDSAKQVGITEYKYLAEPDACDICAELNDKVFKYEDKQIGVNHYPMHSRCRCSTSMYVSREEWDKDLKRRGM